MQVRDLKLRKHLVPVVVILGGLFPFAFRDGPGPGGAVWKHCAGLWDLGPTKHGRHRPLPTTQTHIHQHEHGHAYKQTHTLARIQTHTHREYEHHKHKFEHIKICGAISSGFTLSGRIFFVRERERNRDRGANLATTKKFVGFFGLPVSA